MLTSMCNAEKCTKRTSTPYLQMLKPAFRLLDISDIRLGCAELSVYRTFLILEIARFDGKK